MVRSLNTPGSARRVASALLVAVLAVGLVAGTAFAAKGGGGKPGGGGGTDGATVSVVMVTDQNANGAPNWGDQVTFRFSTSASAPIISLVCQQGGATVYGDSRPMYWPNIWNDPGVFTLSSMSWTGGDATCTATLKAQTRNKISTLGSTTFAVGG